MPSVDNKVVSMTFDNSNFEKNVARTLESLDRLNKNLEKIGTTNGFDEVGRAASNLKLDSVAAGVETVSNRFSNMGIVGMTVIQRLTNAAINLGNKLVSSTTGLVTGAFQGGMQRSLNLEQANFLLEGLGANVEKIMGEGGPVLNAVEGTAYGMDEAAKAAASFYSSGITDLDKLGDALLAVSGVAATTGSDYQSMADIFTTVAGNGRLMGEQLIQFSSRGLNVAAIMAKELGKSEQEVREMVSKGEIDFETFSNVMSKKFGEHAKDANKTFTGSMANMQTAMKKIGAYFTGPYLEHMIGVFNSLREGINKFAVPLKVLGEEFGKDFGKITKAFVKFNDAIDFTPLGDAIVNLYRSFKYIAKEVRKIFKTYFKFPEAKEITELFKRLSAKAHEFRKIINNESVKDVFHGIAISLKVVITTFKSLFSIAKTVIGFLGEAIEEVFGNYSNGDPMSLFVDGLSNVLDIIESFAKSIKSMTWIKDLFVGLLGIVKAAFNILGGAFSGVTGALSNFKNIFTGAISVAGKGASVFAKIGKSISEFISGLDVFKTIGNIFTGILGVLEKVAGKIIEIFGKLTSKAGESMPSINDFLRLLGGGAIVATLMKIGKLVARIKITIADIGSLFNLGKFSNTAIGKTLLELKMTLQSYQKTVKAGAIMRIAIAVFLLAGAMKLISTIDTAKAIGGIAAVAALIGMLEASMAGFVKIFSSGNAKQTAKSVALMRTLSTAMIKMSVAVLILASALKTIGELGLEKAAVGLGGIVALMAVMVAVVKLLSSSTKDTKRMTKGIGSLILLAVSLKILASAMKDIGNMGLGKAAIAVGALGVIMGELVAFTKLVGKAKIKDMVGLVILATGIKIIAGAFAAIANISWGGLAKGASVFTLVLLEMVGLTHVLGEKTSGLIKASASILILGIAMRVLSDAFISFSKLDWAGLAKGAAVITLLSVLMIGLSKTMGDKTGKMIAGSVAILIMSAAMVVLSGAIKTIGEMKLENMVQGLLGVAAAMIIIAAISKMASLKGSAGILICAIGVTLLAAALKKLGEIPIKNLIVGVAAMGVALLILVGVGYLAQGCIVGLLGLAVALIAIGAASILFGIGIGAIVNSIGELGDSIRKLVDGVMDSIDRICSAAKNLVKTIISIIKEIIKGIKEVVQDIIEIFGKIITEAAKLVGKIRGIVKEIIGIIKDIVKGILDVIDDILESVSGFVEDIVEILAGLGDAIKEIVEGICESFNLIIDTITDLPNKIGELFSNLGNTVSGFVEGIDTSVSSFGVILTDTIPGFLADLGEGITNTMEVVGNFGQDFADAFDKMANGLIDAANSIKKNVGPLTKAITGAIGASIKAVAQAIPQFAQDVIDALISFIDQMGIVIENNAEPLSKSFKRLGKHCWNAFLIGLGLKEGNKSPDAKKSMEGIMKSTEEGMTARGLIKKTEEILSDTKTAADKKADNFSKTGSNITTKTSSGMSAAAPKKAMESILVSTKNSANTSQFSGIGSSISSAISSGMSTQTVANKIRSICSNAITIAKAILHINSPSKVFIKIASGISEGMVVGLNRTEDNVYGKVKSMASNVSTAFENALDIINSDMSANPTITPVLDLSEIQSGVTDMNSMFDTTSFNARIAANTMSLQKDRDEAFATKTQEKLIDGIQKMFESTEENQNGEYSFEIPVLLDGRQVARATASYTQEELDKLQTRNNRMLGRI